LAVIITSSIVRSALRDHRNGETSDIIDRRVPGLMIRAVR
jgi:hypothetical protein